MIISASLNHNFSQNHIVLQTDGNKKSIEIPVKQNGQGSAVNGGELLFLALATCCCNDLYREAARRKISIHSVNVSVIGEFGAEGQAGANIFYKVNIESDASQDQIRQLIRDVDQIAEIHNTLRKGVPVKLQNIDDN